MYNLYLSVFDLDHTLITRNSSFQFLRYLRKKKLISYSDFLSAAWVYSQHLFFGLPLTELHKRVFERLLKGQSADIVESQVAPFIQTELPQLLNMSIVSQLRFAQQMGHYTVILSNSADFLVRSIAQYLEVDNYKATSYTLDHLGNFNGIAQMIDGPEKALYLKNLIEELKIQKAHVKAYSDSFLDLPLLLEAGEPIAVSPDKQLKSYAEAHNWTILN